MAACTAYLSERCAHSRAFVAALDAAAPSVRVERVDVERAAELPWYVTVVPTLVVETEEGLSVYEADDAFGALGDTAGAADGAPRDADPVAADDEPRPDDSSAGAFEELFAPADRAALDARTHQQWGEMVAREARAQQEMPSVEKQLERLMAQRGLT